jgi:putative toxin-antitoxin system antitoxin component (TIGR02293 family)
MKNYTYTDQDTLFASEPSAEVMIKYARTGIDMTFIKQTMDRLRLSLKEIADILHISLRTLQRYKDDTKLDTDASSKVIYLKKLESTGVRVFGSYDAFAKWLRTPILALDGFTPLSYLDTPFGFELVEQTLGRIEHGIFA